MTGTTGTIYCNMKAIPQYRVSFPNNYNRIIHNIAKKFSKTQDIGQTNGKMHLILRINIYMIRAIDRYINI